MQRFKENDNEERKVTAIFLPESELLLSERQKFFDEAFFCYELGSVLYDLKRDPMSGVVTKNVFRSSFPEIHNLFTMPGTFDFYIDVFRAIWGNDVEIEFITPSPGVLFINIHGASISYELFMARRIENGRYVYDEVITHDGDNIVFQGQMGIKTQRELDALMNEIHPGGIFVKATLVND